MFDGKCNCNGKKPGEPCPACTESEPTFFYWCDACGQSAGEKRCPLCGLKARKVRHMPSSRTR